MTLGLGIGSCGLSPIGANTVALRLSIKINVRTNPSNLFFTACHSFMYIFSRIIRC